MSGLKNLCMLDVGSHVPVGFSNQFPDRLPQQSKRTRKDSKWVNQGEDKVVGVRGLNEKRKSKGILRQECCDGTQCNHGAKTKATVVHVATVLRPLVTSEWGLLSPSLI